MQSTTTTTTTTIIIIIIIIKFSFIGTRRISPLSQMQGQFTKAMLRNIS